MLERARELGVVHPSEIDRRRSPLPIAGDDPIDPPALLPGFEVEQRAALLRDVLRMVDDLAIHVDDVERAVGTVGREDRPEPGVARGEEVAPGPRRLRGERHAVRRHRLPLDQVLRRLADEDAAAMPGRQRITAMDVHTARRGERPGVWRAHQAGNERRGRRVAADRPDRGLRARAETSSTVCENARWGLRCR